MKTLFYELGDPDKGNMLEVVARVRNLNGKVSSFSTMVVVLPPLDDDEEILKESNKDIQNKIEEGDFISAASKSRIIDIFYHFFFFSLVANSNHLGLANLNLSGYFTPFHFVNLVIMPSII